jgi:hypothetical protein
METIDFKNLIIKLEQEHYPRDPRKEFDHLGTMAFYSKKYSLGDKPQLNIVDCQAIETNKAFLSLPVYMYDHSGITISTKPFGCHWDSGKLGIIYCEYAKARKEGLNPSKLKALLESEVKEYDQYLTGDVWCYSIETTDKEQLDSCCGFYGYSYCLAEAKTAAMWWYKELKRKALQEAKEHSWYTSQL